MLPVDLAPSPRQGRPCVTLSYAQSLDGCLTTARGQPTALSGYESLAFTHRLRAAHDAILVGIGTVLADNPRLTVRLAEGPNPQPVVVDTSLRFPLDASLSRPWIFTGNDIDPQKRVALEERGARVFCLPLVASHRLDLAALLKILTQEGIASLMVEGGVQVISSFLQAGLVDQVAITIAPLLLNGLHAPEAVLTSPVRLLAPSYQRLGDDMIVWGKV